MTDFDFFLAVWTERYWAWNQTNSRSGFNTSKQVYRVKYALRSFPVFKKRKSYLLSTCFLRVKDLSGFFYFAKCDKMINSPPRHTLFCLFESTKTNVFRSVSKFLEVWTWTTDNWFKRKWDSQVRAENVFIFIQAQKISSRSSHCFTQIK